MPDTTHQPASGLLRRLAALLYDVLLVIALAVIPISLLMALRGGEPVPPGEMRLLLLATAAAFFVGFWMYGGQTLGMRAWRLRVERQTGEPLSFRAGLLRFGIGLLTCGLGLLWIPFNPQKLAWHDRASGTRVVVVPKRTKASANPG